MNKPVKIVLNALCILLKVVIIFFGAFWSFLFPLLFGYLLDPNVYYASFVLIAAFWILMLAWVLPKRRVRRVKKGVAFGGLAVMLAGIIAVGSCVGYNRYIDSIRIRVDNSAINTEEYLAFHPDSKIARLDHEASLHFSEQDNLPVLDGAAAFFPLYSAFVEAVYPETIPALNTWYSADYRYGPYAYHNTITGYYYLIDGLVDVMFAFGPDADQLAYAEDSDVELEFIPIGYEGFVFFTNKKNPVTNLTEDEIRAIYAGEITNWKDVGGENTKILPYQRNSGSGSQTALIEFMGEKPLMQAPTELVNGMMTGIIEAVADYQNHRGAIGFSFHQYAEEIVANENIHLLAINGVQPTRETISNDSYPVLMPFYMVIRKGERTEEMDTLIEWVLSEDGQTLVEMSGFARADHNLPLEDVSKLCYHIGVTNA